MARVDLGAALSENRGGIEPRCRGRIYAFKNEAETDEIAPPTFSFVQGEGGAPVSETGTAALNADVVPVEGPR